MSELPAIAIEPTAENDLIFVFDALLSTRDAALLVSRPRVLLQTYRAELGLLHDMIFFEADPQVEASPEVHHDEDPVLDGSILR
jgi:hypothetical protein